MSQGAGPWSIELLGRLSIRRSPGHGVHLPPSAPALLFARLAMSPGRRFSREMLCDLLWPGEDLEVARPRLRTTLARAREFFGESSPIEADRLEVWLDPAAAMVDFDELRRSLKRLPTLEPRERPAKALEAVEAYKGPLLPDFQDQWIAAARRDLIDSICKLAVDVAQEMVAEANPDPAIRILTLALCHEPINEAASVTLLKAYEVAERYAEGVKASWEIRSSWQRDIGSDPPGAVRAIEAILWSKLSSPLHVVRKRGDSGLIGREKELGEIRTLLDRHRCVTLVGIGGVGKTSLARVLFEEGDPSSPTAAVFVDLCDVRPDADLCRTLLQALGLAEQADVPPSDRLCEVLAAQSRLLILDNCEHLIEPCRSLCQLLLLRTASVRLLITSRAPLVLQREVLYEVVGLRVPGDGEEAGSCSAVRMFIESAAKWLPKQVGPTELATIAAITRQLDGIPLGLELAAARLRLLSLDETRARLEQNIDLLTGSNPRRSIRGAIEWSMSRLSDPARRCLLHLSVFSAGWTVEDIAAALEWEDEALDAITELMEGSLVQRIESEDQPRFRLLESVKAIALEQLEASGLGVAARDRHLRAYCELPARRTVPPSFAGSKGFLSGYQAADANYLAALRWAVVRPTIDDLGLRLAKSLAYYLTVRGNLFEGVKLYGELMARNDPYPSIEIEMAVLFGYGRMLSVAGDSARAREKLERCLARSEEAGLAARVGNCHYTLATVGMVTCDLDDAEYHLTQIVVRPVEDRYQMIGIYGMAALSSLRGRFEAGIELARETIGRATGLDDSLVAHSKILVGSCAVHLGLGVGRELAKAAYEECLGRGDRYGIAGAMHVLALYEREDGDLAEAYRLCSEVIEIRTTLGESRMTGATHCLRANIALLAGKPAECLDELTRASKATAEFPWLAEAGYDSTKARALMDLGRWDEATDVLAQGLCRGNPLRREVVQTDLLMAHAELRYRTGEAERGAVSLATAIQVRKDRGWVWYADARRPCSPLGEPLAVQALDLQAAVEAAGLDLGR